MKIAARNLSKIMDRNGVLSLEGVGFSFDFASKEYVVSFHATGRTQGNGINRDPASKVEIQLTQAEFDSMIEARKRAGEEQAKVPK